MTLWGRIYSTTPGEQAALRYLADNERVRQRRAFAIRLTVIMVIAVGLVAHFIL